MRSNDEIVTIIEDKMKEDGLSLSELARRVGMAKSAISRYFNRTREFPLNRINEFSNVLDLDPKYILGFEDQSDIQELYDKLTPPRQHKVYTFAEHQLEEQNNVIHLADRVEEDSASYATSEQDLYGGVSAGTGQTVFNNPVEQVTIPINIIPKQPYDIMLKVVGDSMEPAFKDGEYVFIKKTKEIRSGQFVVVIIDGEAYLKKAYLEDDFMRLVSLNEKYEDIIVTAGSTIEIVGVVVL